MVVGRVGPPNRAGSAEAPFDATDDGQTGHDRDSGENQGEPMSGCSVENDTLDASNCQAWSEILFLRRIVIRDHSDNRLSNDRLNVTFSYTLVH